MIKLPAYTFLNAPAGSGKTTLAQLLSEQDQGLIHLSFAAPLRMALLATFYPEELPMGGLNLQDQTVKKRPIVGTNYPHERFLIDYGNWLKEKTNAHIIGDLGKRAVDSVRSYYTRFLFDDARIVADIAPFINAFGAEECMLIHIERRDAPGRAGDVGDTAILDLPGIRHVRIPNNGSVLEMLFFLQKLLGGTVEGPVPAAILADL